MTHSVQFSVRPVPGKFEFSYFILDETGPNDLNAYVKNYPSQAELEDDLGAAGLSLSMALVGRHGPIDATDEQLAILRRQGNQDYR